MSAIEVVQPPEDSISCLKFSPESVPQTFLIGTSWANDIRCWEIEDNGKTVPKAIKNHDAPILSACWSQDGTKVFTASCDKTAKMWDLQANQFVQIAQHDAPIKTIHHIVRPNYSCVMTGSWDKTLKFWDLRSPTPLGVIQLPERCYCADVSGPMAIVSGANRFIKVYNLDNKPQEVKTIDSPLKYQHRCVSIFLDKNKNPTGFALGSIEGRVAIQYVDTPNPKDNFTFKCHRSQQATSSQPQDIYAVNDIAFHPIYMTLATVGSDGKFSFWDKDARTKLKTPDLPGDQPITCCAIDARGKIFAYALSYDWHKGHEYNNPNKKNQINLFDCAELKPKNRT
ncbi:mRNA export factor [Brachionus plicatilis]|uniref:mRNA export factor n=1 Tax=Brachionus plicatilis TaxID=10195 RepID=A0A3M7QDC6_BRAPC|nr:mRNA export factor [Brachionus plicatilis]